VSVFTGTLVCDLLLGDVHSLKERRGLVKPLLADLRREFAVSVAEVGDANLHRRVEVAVAVVAGDGGHVTEVLDRCERLVAGRPEFTLLATRRWLRTDDDE
jgi:uncharacterized protein YlxP (DUF503 family)